MYAVYRNQPVEPTNNTLCFEGSRWGLNKRCFKRAWWKLYLELLYVCFIYFSIRSRKKLFPISIIMPLTRQNELIHNELGRELNKEQEVLMTCQFSEDSFTPFVDYEWIFPLYLNWLSINGLAKVEGQIFLSMCWCHIFRSLKFPSSWLHSQVRHLDNSFQMRITGKKHLKTHLLQTEPTKAELVSETLALESQLRFPIPSKSSGQITAIDKNWKHTHGP